MSEDKAEITKAFGEVLKKTAAGYDLESLTYMKKGDDEEIVTAIFKNGTQKFANVHWDSGIALIEDVLKQIFRD